jgi:hypothetical protein
VLRENNKTTNHHLLRLFWAKNLYFVSCWQTVFLSRHTISHTLCPSQSGCSLQFFVSSFPKHKAHITYSTFSHGEFS